MGGQKRGMEWAERPLFDTEIIPSKGLRSNRLYFFTTPAGMRFQYYDFDYKKHHFDIVKGNEYTSQYVAGMLGRPHEFKIKDIVIGSPSIISKKAKEKIVKNARLSFSRFPDREIKTFDLSRLDFYNGIQGRILDVLPCSSKNVFHHLHAEEAFHVEIKWASNFTLKEPVFFSVFLLGSFLRLKEKPL